MRAGAKTVYTWLSNLLLIAIIATCGLEVLAPARWWMSVRKIYVHDAIVGDPNLISIDITWRRSFFMRWHTTIKRATNTTESQFEAICSTDGATSVYPGQKIPNPLTMQTNWFQGASCANLRPGTYYLETTWTWQDWLINRELPVDSNVFHVLPVGSPPIPGDTP